MKSNNKIKCMVYPKIEFVVFYYQIPIAFFNLLMLSFNAHLNMHSKKNSFLCLFNNKKPTKKRLEP